LKFPLSPHNEDKCGAHLLKAIRDAMVRGVLPLG
jgi:hypothetical protein